MITPCRHLLCLDCVALDSHGCTLPGCGRQYEMQSPETLARPENPNPKWPVPKDLIELQPSYQQVPVILVSCIVHIVTAFAKEKSACRMTGLQTGNRHLVAKLHTW